MLGESVSGLYAYHAAKQITEDDFKAVNELAYNLENGLLRLVQSLERKRLDSEWVESLIVKGLNEAYA
jgi:hypothetical protein